MKKAKSLVKQPQMVAGSFSDQRDVMYDVTLIEKKVNNFSMSFGRLTFFCEILTESLKSSKKFKSD